jgi:hypothetical protein
MDNYYAFVSYAGEDTQFAYELVGGLKSRGLDKIWYAPLSLKVGDKILDSIEEGMKKSKAAILILSKAYLEKSWTNYEMDTLLRQSIEQDKKVFPIWIDVTKQDVENRHTGLGGIWALNSSIGLSLIVKNLIEVLGLNVPTVCHIPSYESPKSKFLQGSGELILNHEDGLTTTLWELLIYNRNSQYPIYIDGEIFTRRDLLFQAATLLVHSPEVVKNRVRDEGYKTIWEMCKQEGFDPETF